MTMRGQSAIVQAIRNCGKRAAFIPFVSAGDPNEDVSYRILLELAQFSDVIEVGVPYSDPLADGPVIQAGSLRALQAGMTLPRALRLIARVRAVSDVPIVIFTYVNPVVQYGADALMQAAADAGADGLIIPDLPYEESAETRAAAARRDLALIPLISLTSHERVQMIAASATGFAYCVSSLGVTGERAAFAAELRAFVDTVKQASSVPVAVGFGVSSPQQVRELAAFADGVIVGSAIVRRCEDIQVALTSGDAARLDESIQALSAAARELSEAGR